MIRDILKKYLLPGGLAVMTTDAWYQSRFGAESHQKMWAERNEAITKLKEAQDNLTKATETLDEHLVNDFIIKAKSFSLYEKNEKVKSLLSQIHETQQKLNSTGLDSHEISSLKGMLESKHSALLTTVTEQTNSVKELTTEITRSVSSHQMDTVSQSVNTSPAATLLRCYAASHKEWTIKFYKYSKWIYRTSFNRY